MQTLVAAILATAAFDTLAQSTSAGEWVRNGLMSLNLLISVALGLGLYWLGGKAREVDGMKKELHDTATKLIDERFRSATHELRGSVQGLVTTIDLMQAQLKDGSGDLRALGDRDQRIELSLATRVDQLKDFIRDHAATKQDLEAHEASMERKVEKLETKIGELSSAVAVLSDRSGGKKGGRLMDLEASNRKRDRRLRRRLLKLLFNARMGPRGGLGGRMIADVVSTDPSSPDRVEDEHLLGLLRDLEAGGYVLLIDERTHPKRQRELDYLFAKIAAKGTGLVNETVPRDPDIEDERDPEGT